MTQLIFFAVMMALGFGFGRYAESRHYRSIAERERLLSRLPTVSGDTPGVPFELVERTQLVAGSVVISVDYFKRVVAALRTLFGGNVQSYESLVDRARREAVLRLKEQCPGASQIVNLRIETSSIHTGRGNGIGSVEVLAYGTAIYSDRG
ncbi:MAG: heavy metal-binding domain-containing protein [Pseudomonadota bacterium]